MNGPGGTFPRVRPAARSGPMASCADRGCVVPFTGARAASSATPYSRPAPAAPVLGTITGATAVSTGSSVELTAAGTGRSPRLRLLTHPTGSATDCPRVRSGEAGSAASRPQLESHLRS